MKVIKKDLWFLGVRDTLLRVSDIYALVAQMVRSLLAMQKTQVWSLSQEDPLEKEMETHSSKKKKK